MDIRSIKSIQRVVNFTLKDGKMVQAEHKGAIIPGVTMTCDLPLLFINGLPTCLEHLTVGQLEKFVPYMIKCSGISAQTKPKWWPSDMHFSTTPAKTLDMTESKWLLYLKRLVSSCYSYHGCEYALRLCPDPHKCRSSESTLKHRLGETPSLYNVPSQRSPAFQTEDTYATYGKSILENRLLSKRSANCESMRKNMPPVQIFLCDKCGAEFSTLKEVRGHERVCIRKRDSFIPCKQTDHRAIANNLSVSHNQIHTPDNDLNIHNMSTRSSQIQCSTQCSKKPTARKTIVSGNSKVPKILENVISMKHRHTCKNCKQLFVSLKLTRDHEKLCLQQRSSVLCSSSLKKNSYSFSSGNGQLSSKIILQSAHAPPQANNNSPLRKKKMSLMPSKRGEVSVSDLPHSEVFLCENCNREFMSVIDIQQHEILGCQVRRELTPSPVVSTGNEELTQKRFLNYFKLSPSHLPSASSSALQVKKFSRNPLRYSAIPVSSMLGNLIHGSQVPISSILSKIDKVERYCPAKPVDVYEPLEETYDAEAWKVSWKPRKTTQINSVHVHTYKYPVKRWWKMPSLWRAQNKIKERNGRLLRLCKPLEIKIRKLTTQEIHLYSTCRSVTPKLKKLSSKEIQLYTQSYSVSPKLRRLSSLEIEAYTGRCTIAPKVRRLSFQEIKKHVKSNDVIAL